MKNNFKEKIYPVREFFSNGVYQAVKKIPFGKVATYKIIAVYINKPKASRAVGQILNKNPRLISIPCHRVVYSNGFVGGYAKGIKTKIKILKKEGIKIKNNKIDLKRFGFIYPVRKPRHL